MKTRTIGFRDAQIELAHGAGGKATRRLIEGLFVPYLDNERLAQLADAAYVEANGQRLAVTADSFVVKPLTFPGGTIGELAVNGTVNDLAVSGARPIALLTTFILEAGLPTNVLEPQVETMARAAQNAGVPIVGGDTKVVEHGQCDGMYITSSGLGVVDPRASLSAKSVRPGDQVLVSGPIGDHGITILLARGDLDLEADLSSDTRSVWPFVDALLSACGPHLRWMRDPTRGGVATALNELARDADVAVTIFEEAIPVRDPVRGACEILGLDPLHIACEGQFLAVVGPEAVDIALAALRSVPGGEGAVRIGEIGTEPSRTVIGHSSYGGHRVIDVLVGDPLPRIC
ncbi:hydrogenase expression/formation protein HypE [Sulfobacillus acidophilus TPY]|uniref:Hydrogenase expression/formation protein HypE n=1 Tax=Sulfobacillus acidophilus (strain ATCC 700253 / DSM 10332 / NAL) TaxID=679936 RepID=G8U1T6_SULAD|nr:hydrogenase expression/formation protein HypE [Sulfobacillus acidophilus TPY]AEW07014.1 hydrogenase expression/formation protein HypE [Sulfobacillus acidophilus DSM 10332]